MADVDTAAQRRRDVHAESGHGRRGLGCRMFAQPARPHGRRTVPRGAPHGVAVRCRSPGSRPVDALLGEHHRQAVRLLTVAARRTPDPHRSARRGQEVARRARRSARGGGRSRSPGRSRDRRGSGATPESSFSAATKSSGSCPACCAASPTALARRRYSDASTRSPMRRRSSSPARATAAEDGDHGRRSGTTRRIALAIPRGSRNCCDRPDVTGGTRHSVDRARRLVLGERVAASLGERQEARAPRRPRCR